jgi:hypothetical protein
MAQAIEHLPSKILMTWLSGRGGNEGRKISPWDSD